MIAIYRYTLPVVTMPRGARVVHFGSQDDQLCVWAIVDPIAPLQSRLFYIVGTGEEIPKNIAEIAEYVSTYVHPKGMVWHLFEIPHGDK